MAKTKVSKSEFSKFLNLLILKGEISNNESIFEFTKDTCKVLVRLGESGGGALRGVLKSKFEEWGKIGVSNLPLLLNFVNSFSSNEIELNLDGNKLKITAPKEKLKMSYLLGNPDYIKNKPDETKFDSILAQKGIEFTLTKEQIKDMVKFFSVLGSGTDVGSLKLEVSGKTLTLFLKNDKSENELEYSIDLEKEVGDMKLKFTPMLIDVLNTLGTDIVIALHPNFAYMRTESKEYKVEYMVTITK